MINNFYWLPFWDGELSDIFMLRENKQHQSMVGPEWYLIWDLKVGSYQALDRISDTVLAPFPLISHW